MKWQFFQNLYKKKIEENSIKIEKTRAKKAYRFFISLHKRVENAHVEMGLGYIGLIFLIVLHGKSLFENKTSFEWGTEMAILGLETPIRC